jgi:hypothetical protein
LADQTEISQFDFFALPVTAMWHICNLLGNHHPLASRQMPTHEILRQDVHGVDARRPASATRVPRIAVR